MSSYLRPRRGKKATAEAQLTSSTPLKRGEIFFEVPTGGVGTGLGKIKMGDGATGYSSLPYFLEQLDPDNAKVAFTDSSTASSDPYTANPTLATAIAPTASLKTIFTNLKQLLVNYNSQLTSLNNDYPRMKDHGTFTTLAQVEAFLTAHKVSTGEFFDIRVGDYFKLAGYTVYVAGLDTEYNKGDTEMSAHHITCIANFGNSKMNNDNTTAGGYEGASVMQAYLAARETELTNAAGSHVKTRRVLTTNSVGTDGKSNNWAWTDHKLTLMSETQIYGSIQWGNVYDTGEGYEKLPIFNYLTPLQVFGRTDVWLRGVFSATDFCVSSGSGYPRNYYASLSLAAGALFIIG